jgi:tetratricopeptide (TPR) repeat protein
MRCYRYLGFSFLFSWALQAFGGVPAGWHAYPTDEELNSLPPYCRVKLRSDPKGAEFKSMEAIYGPDWGHTHHLCAGLNDLNRYYQARTPQDRRFNLNNAYGNLSYMVNHAAASFILMPEVYINRGQTLALMNRDGEAIADLERATELNPKADRAYMLLADLWAKLKQHDKALAVVTEGLRQIPKSKALMHRYDRLGGKKPYPEPYPHPEEKPADEIKPSTAATPEQIPAPRDQASDLSSAAVRSARDAQPKPATNPNTESTRAVGGQSRRNPWCRFCPEDDNPPNPASSTGSAESTNAE